MANRFQSYLSCTAHPNNGNSFASVIRSIFPSTARRYVKKPLTSISAFTTLHSPIRGTIQATCVR
ncbi:hypothetical protein T02_36 [Trichinella nativa]|uniref:Uncharacterized protein n=1 Tax=Trichinella nativa TaxID=6335 RepID=A0A0V1LHB6_9BILA|nr:hypothetical protein T02_36 [Trichinella nativa]